MAHRQSYREGPAHSSIATPVDCNEDYTYQDNRDAQQVADDSIAFLRTFSIRLQRFRAQVGEFAHVDQPDDIETSDNGPIKVTNTTADDTRSNGSSSPPANKRGDPPVKQLMHAPRLCEQCESSRAEPVDIPPQSPATETNQTPPCLDDTYPDHPFPEGTRVALRVHNLPPSLRGTYVAKYLDIRRPYAAIGPERDSPHPGDPPPMVEDGSDKSNSDVEPINQQPAPDEQETTATTCREALQPIGNTKKTMHIEQETPPISYHTTPSGRLKQGFAILGKERIKHTTNSRTHSTDTTPHHEAEDRKRKRASVLELTTRETNEVTNGLIAAEDTSDREITGIIPDRGKKSRHEALRVNSIYNRPTQ